MLPQSLDGQRAALVGYGRAHRSLARRLLAEGAEVFACDRSEQARAQAQEDGVVGAFGPGYLEALLAQRPAFAFLTPGIRKDLPAFASLAADGTILSSETAFFFARRARPVLGITGSAGKTTTTTLVGRMLARQGIPAAVCGNIGRPLTDALADEGAITLYVAEFSSFQLQNLEHSPEIAGLLNIRPNHLDVHSSFEDYAQSKWRIARFQDAQGSLVLPWELQKEAAGMPGRVLTFSTSERADARLRDGELFLHGRRLLSASELRLPGRHNVENALAAALLAEAAGADDTAIAEELRSFGGVAHRLEVVAEVAGVRCVNDSIATAPDRAMAAFDALEGPFVWLAGGYDKHLDYRELARRVRSVRLACLFGPVGETLLELLRQEAIPARHYNTFDDAVQAALAAAEPGDTVLLSPAAASYDSFRSFEERGERFRELVLAALRG
ncbi:MAG: UDP-N-acetylmuramoyl-L-alanine--D-glutamate ligase [Thermaerobacter sp.]|nr:UDP-N-acetylmuramoyl-L-alanine--D-glutamate ligase [Thermaerobacter sp.]